MNYLGWVLAVVGLVGLIFGILQMLKAKKMQTVPYRKPSEIIQMGQNAADAKGLVSTEGQVSPGPVQLTAPMTGQPCLAYEVTIERKWEKMVMTEKGQQKKTGTEKVHTETKGAVFNLGDGTGQIIVDATAELDADMEKTHSQTHSIGMMIPGTLTFGSMQMNTPHVHGDNRTTAFTGTEKILKPSPTMYALGALSPGQYGLSVHTPKGIGTGKLILSPHGREKLLGKTKRNMILGYALGGVLFLGGGGLGLFGPKVESTGCDSKFAGAVSCDGRLSSASGIDYTWTVAEAGVYSLTTLQPNVKVPIDSVLTVLDSGGNKVAYSDGGSPGANAHIQQKFEAGTYKITVSDFDKKTVEGGFGFHLTISKLGSDAPVSSGAPVASGAGTGAAATHPAATGAHPATSAKPAATGAATAAATAAPKATGAATAAPKKK